MGLRGRGHDASEVVSSWQQMFTESAKMLA